MNRRQKIIVSVTGIFLVLLILVGLTYAFFLTRINGNTNPTSISVTTANLELVYGDDDGSIIGDGMVIEPDTVIGEKTFTVTNNGNDTIDSYAVVIENLAIKYKETQTLESGTVTAGQVTSLVNGEDGEPDMQLVITCTSSVEGKTCNGMDGFLPEKSGILLTNSIEEDEVHTYTATLTYLEDGTNQSDDMNKTIEGRFNIIDTNNTVDIEGTVENAEDLTKVTINSEYKESVIYPDGTYRFVGVKPDIHTIRTVGSETTEIGKLSVVKGESANVGTTTYNGVTIPEITITNSSRNATVNLKETIEASKPLDYIEGTLAYEIYNNALNATGNATVLGNPISEFGVGSPENERVLASIEDVGGTTSHYFRGNVVDNYVTFSNMCWRAIRIQGDKTVKLILEDELAPCETSTSTDNDFICVGYHPDLEDLYGGSTYWPRAYSVHENLLQSWISNEKTFDEVGYPTELCFERNINQDRLANVSEGINTLDDTVENIIEEYDEINVTEYFNTRLLNSPKLGGTYNKKVSLITADEAVLAGLGSTTGSSYLSNFSDTIATVTKAETYEARQISSNEFYMYEQFSNYEIKDGKISYILASNGMWSDDQVEHYYTPVIALKADVPFETNTTNNGIVGSKTNPYVIK